MDRRRDDGEDGWVTVSTLMGASCRSAGYEALIFLSVVLRLQS